MDQELSQDLSQLFLDPAYSIEQILALAKQKNLNLQQLKDHLLKHQQQLNQDSIELFNNSYDRFYKLSYVTSCLNEPIQALINPIERFHSKLQQLCYDHDTYLATINQKLAGLEENAKNQILATKLISLVERHERIENQIQKIDWSLKPSQVKSNRIDIVEYTVKCDLLERVYIELFHLGDQVNALSPTHDELISVKKTLLANIANHQYQLDCYFQTCFVECIECSDKDLMNLIVRTYRQTGELAKLNDVWQTKVVEPYISLTSIPDNPFSTVTPQQSDQSQPASPKFQLKVSTYFYTKIIECWAPHLYLESLDSNFTQMACRVFKIFSDWLSNLRLSDFRIVGSATSDNLRQTNFLAQQDAIMRLLIADCDILKTSVNEFIGRLPSNDSKASAIRNELIQSSLASLECGLDNVKSLQHLIER